MNNNLNNLNIFPILTILLLSQTLLFDLYHNTNLEYSTTLSLLEYERERGNEIEMRSNVLIVEEEKDVTIQLCKKCHKLIIIMMDMRKME